MITCTVHEPPDPPADRLDRAEGLYFVKDGFTWSAAIFGPLWLVARGLWLMLLLYLLAVILIALGVVLLDANADALVFAIAALNLVLGFEADAIQRLMLDLRGWRMISAVSGRSIEDCERRFFDSWIASEAIAARMRATPPTGASGHAPHDIEPVQVDDAGAGTTEDRPRRRRWLWPFRREARS